MSAPVIAAATATTSAPASEPQAHAAGAVSSCASDANGSVVHALMERHYVQDTLESTSGARRLLHFVLFLSPCLAQNAVADKWGDRRVQDFAAAFGLAFALIGRADPDLIQIVLLSVRVSLGAVALACLIGMPLGALLAVGRFPGRGALIVLLNALMGLPPVVVGLLVYLTAIQCRAAGRAAAALHADRHGHRPDRAGDPDRGRPGPAGRSRTSTPSTPSSCARSACAAWRPSARCCGTAATAC